MMVMLIINIILIMMMNMTIMIMVMIEDAENDWCIQLTLSFRVLYPDIDNQINVFVFPRLIGSQNFSSQMTVELLSFKVIH